MMAAKGVDIERSTVARRAGYAAACSIRSTTASVRSAVPAVRSTPPIHGFRSWRPATARHKGALWVYVTYNRNSGSQKPPLARYRATMGRAARA
ncbi:hypothetical protein [Mesorhizobium sp. M1300]|uniref:hypothetical protein n=1 Tax=Mesorhizobium sp. M1300 TaxID=2957077 RepID=UPI00333672DD